MCNGEINRTIIRQRVVGSRGGKGDMSAFITAICAVESEAG